MSVVTYILVSMARGGLDVSPIQFCRREPDTESERPFQSPRRGFCCSISPSSNSTGEEKTTSRSRQGQESVNMKPYKIHQENLCLASLLFPIILPQIFWKDRQKFHNLSRWFAPAGWRVYLQLILS